MSDKKVLLDNLISSKNNIKRKVLDMKRGVIDSDNYFRQAFKPIIEPLNTIIENKNNDSKLQKIINNEYNDEDDQALSNFAHFLNTSPQSRVYDKAFGLHYDEKDKQLKIANVPVTINDDHLHVLDKKYSWTPGLWSLLCEKNPTNFKFNDYEAYYNILKSTKVHLKTDGKPKANSHNKWINIVKPLYERMRKELDNLDGEYLASSIGKSVPHLNISSFDDSNVSTAKKRSKTLNDPAFQHKRFKYSQSKDGLNMSKSLDDLWFENGSLHSNSSTDLINFEKTLKSDQVGISLYKDVIPNTQIVYYDDPNELVTRLNLLISSQNAGNTGVNNEVISILEELRERKLKV